MSEDEIITWSDGEDIELSRAISPGQVEGDVAHGHLHVRGHAQGQNKFLQGLQDGAGGGKGESVERVKHSNVCLCDARAESVGHGEVHNISTWIFPDVGVGESQSTVIVWYLRIKRKDEILHIMYIARYIRYIKQHLMYK